MDHFMRRCRRIDWQTAHIVETGLSLQRTFGDSKARRFLRSSVVPASVIERVLSTDLKFRRK